MSPAWAPLYAAQLGREHVGRPVRLVDAAGRAVTGTLDLVARLGAGDRLLITVSVLPAGGGPPRSHVLAAETELAVG